MPMSLRKCSQLLHKCARGTCENCPYYGDRETLACVEQLMVDVEHTINHVITQVHYLQEEVFNQ